jgi:ubiquitin thioesterase protein OTUB1
MTVGELVTRLCDENTSNLIVMFIRLVTSAEIQRRAGFFMPFIDGMIDVPMAPDEFCRRFVECMGEESDHIQLVATADAFNVRLSFASVVLEGFATTSAMFCSPACILLVYKS